MVVAAVTFALCSLGCGIESRVPDQGQFVPLADLADSGMAVVRLYSAPVPPLGPVATHAWFVVKQPEANAFDRWEVWPFPDSLYAYVHRNLLAAEADVGAGGTFIVAELVGPDAEPIVEFIKTASPDYPCRNRYRFCGPNCNTYAQWVLDSTEWDIDLPPTAIGQDAPPTCP